MSSLPWVEVFELPTTAKPRRAGEQQKKQVFVKLRLNHNFGLKHDFLACLSMLTEFERGGLDECLEFRSHSKSL